MVTQADFKRIIDTINAQAKQIEAQGTVLRDRYSTAENYAEDKRIVDITDRIHDGDPQNPDDLVLSFYQLGEDLFPVEGERETRLGWKQYVQASRNNSLPVNERRILVILDENRKKVIAAVVYGVAVTPKQIYQQTGVSGVVGITYAMVHQDYRGFGLGAFISQKLVLAKTKDFLQKRLNVADPQIILGAEVNDVSKLTLAEAISDIEGAATMPNGRQNFWLKCGFKPLPTYYAQIQLRLGLGEFEALTYHIAGWDEKRISTKLVAYLIKFHSLMCLNKQRGLIEEDRHVLRKMIKSLKSFGSTIPFIPTRINGHISKDQDLIVAINFALEQNRPLTTPMSVVIQEYAEQKTYTAQSSAATLNA